MPHFITLADLARDAHTLATLLPSETVRIVGVARSGVAPASIVAMMLHLPLFILRQSEHDVIDAGHGWRMKDSKRDGLTVLIDDTVMTGNSFTDCIPTARAVFPNLLTAAIYVNPKSLIQPDVIVHPLSHPHLLEWNLANSIFSPHTATDFDGILCRDCLPHELDEGPYYEEFLHMASPLYTQRRCSIPLIVTARLEKHRTETLEWLSRYGMTCKKLVMGPWESWAERERSDIAAFKAEHYTQFLKQNHAIKPPLFIESDERQAKRIAKLSGGIVVCPAAGRCYQ